MLRQNTSRFHRYTNYNSIFNITLALYGVSSIVIGIVYSTIRLIPDIHVFNKGTWKDNDKYYLIAFASLTAIVLISAIFNKLLNNKNINNLREFDSNNIYVGKIDEIIETNKKEKKETLKMIGLMATIILGIVASIAIITGVVLIVAAAASSNQNINTSHSGGCLPHLNFMDILLLHWLFNHDPVQVQHQQTTVVNNNGCTHINTVIQQRPYVRTHNIAQIFVGIVMASIITSIIMLSIKGARVSRNKSQNVMNVCKDIFICLGVTAGIVILSSLFMLLANAISMSSHDIELKASVNSFVSPVDTAPPPPFVSSGADSSVAPPPSYVEAMQIGKAEAMQIGKGG